jgi:nitrous oxide reductase accessory protein NosL
MKRRDLLVTSLLAPAMGFINSTALAQTTAVPSCRLSDLSVDANPLDHELSAYPICSFCGMSRTKWSHTRHLVQYDDGRTEGTCSLRCLALSLALTIDSGPKAIWVGDAGVKDTIKPLIDAETATYTLHPSRPGTMTARRKWAYANPAIAEASGGQLVTFSEALQAAFEDLGRDTDKIRKRRAEKKARRLQKQNQS